MLLTYSSGVHPRTNRIRTLLEIVVVVGGYASIHFSAKSLQLSAKKRRFLVGGLLSSSAKTAGCYPTVPTDNDTNSPWKRNLPAFLIAGAPKSGTSTLSTMISKHPNVVAPTTKELGVFFGMPGTATRKNHNLGTTGATAVASTPLHYHNWTLKQQYLWSRPEWPLEQLQQNENFTTFDANPYYLFHSSQEEVQQNIWCLCPWMKWVVVLRDPAERALAASATLNDGSSSTVTTVSVPDAERKQSPFEALHRELEYFQEMEVTSSHTTTNTKTQEGHVDFYNNVTAWNEFRKNCPNLAKGLYDVQLHYLERQFRKHRKDPSEHLMVLGLEQLKRDWNRVFMRVIHFLGLPRWIPDEMPIARPSGDHRTTHSAAANEEEQEARVLYEQLNEFYGPYNARLKSRVGDDFPLTETDVVVSA